MSATPLRCGGGAAVADWTSPRPVGPPLYTTPASGARLKSVSQGVDERLARVSQSLRDALDAVASAEVQQQALATRLPAAASPHRAVSSSPPRGEIATPSLRAAVAEAELREQVAVLSARVEAQAALITVQDRELSRLRAQLSVLRSP